MAATATTTKITVERSNEVQRNLADLAHRTGHTEAEIIVEAVARHLETEDRPRPQVIGTYSDPEVTSENLDDWLAATWKPDWK